MIRAKDVKHVLDAEGESLTLVEVVDPNYTLGSGSGSKSTTNHTTKGAIVGYRQNLVDGQLVERGDRQVILSAQDLSVKPKVKDRIEGVDEKVNVVDVHTIRAQGSDVAYVCQVRE